ncbi:uncharacterized protein LOC135112269 [Scylla paramamosain]|uniref:uncharacterized protein LOC135112269 n=1 Tax=Scylla paramamosain TaxID=85552 RepID=UPI003083BAA7
MDNVVKECMVCQIAWDNKRHQPVALPACGHSFCRHCLIKLRDIKESVECPICKKALVDMHPEDLPTNWALLQSVDSNPNLEFEEWARASGLTDSTIKKLVSEDLNSRVVLKLMKESDVCQLGLTVGQQRMLMAVVKKLKDTKAGEDDQKAPCDGRKKQSTDNDATPKKDPGEDPKSDDGSSVTKNCLIVAAVEVGVMIATPFVLPAIGFTSAGIAAGSLAGTMMSSAAIANGGAIAAGSTVAVLQSAGAVAGAAAAAGLDVGAEAAALGAKGEKDTKNEKKMKTVTKGNKPNDKKDKHNDK